MAEEIGRADYILGVDNAGVRKGVAESEQLITASGAKAEAAYTSASLRAGQAVGTAIKTGAKVVATAASGLFAIAAKGALDLSNVQADYTAETGATADEAARAGKAINAMSGRNIQGLKEIGSTLAKVHTDLGLVGDEAEQTTELFLKFARATKQDAAASVLAFDDILDAWGLTAKDSGRLMDQLIVSHQRYGGSITDNQRSLATLAPQLRALNLTVDDGIGLLNLFASSGLDASVAQRALNAAIQNLPKGTSLADFVAQLASIEDPAARAAKASEVFGVQAGPKLANAIRPGVASIDAFKVSVEESTGATAKAADALDSTFGSQAQLMLNKFGSAVRGLGADWGPLLTGAASAGSLITAIFGDAALRTLGTKLATAFRAIGSQAGGALSEGLTSVWTGAGGTVAGNFIASRIETIVDSSKNSKIAAAIRVGAAKAGALWGVVFAGAQGVASTLYSAIASTIAASPAAAAIRSAVLAAAIALGTFQGTAVGGAFAAAFALAVAAAPIVIPVVIAKVAGDIFDPGGFKAHLNRLTDDIAAGRKVYVAVGAEAGEAYGDAMIAAAKQAVASGVRSESLGAEVFGPPVTASVRKAVAIFAGKVKDDLAGAGIAREAYKQGLRAAGALANAIRSGRDSVDQAWQDMLDGIKSSTSVTARTATLIGRLASKSLAQGLRDADPAVRAQARYTKQITLDELEQLRPRAGTLSKEAMANLRRAMKNADPDIRRAATDIYNAAISGPKKLTKEKGYAWGSALGAGVAAGLRAQAAAIGAAAGRLAAIIAAYLQTHSPSELGPLSRLGGPEGWGRQIVSLIAKGAQAGMPALNDTLDRALSMSAIDAPFLNRVAQQAVAGRTPAPAQSTVRHGDVSIGAIHLHGVGNDVSPAAATRFGQRIMDEVATGLREQSARTGNALRGRP